MTVMILERVSPSLRGTLSRWLIEVKAGVFVGRLNGLVRNLIWEKCAKELKDGTMIMIWKTNTEQGFDLKHTNCKDYIPINMEGIWLTMHPLFTNTNNQVVDTKTKNKDTRQ